MNIIDIHITIDADTIISDIKTLSKDKNKPTYIDHTKYEFMVVSKGKAISGQGSGTLDFKSSVGDRVRFSASSASNNFNNSVLLYEIIKRDMPNNPDVFGPFSANTFQRDNVFPSGEAVLPAYTRPATFSFLESQVQKTGTEHFDVAMALYTRDVNLAPQLLGYFAWDPVIEVS